MLSVRWREKTCSSSPHSRNSNRADADVPATDPVDIHCPEHPFGIADIEDVRVVISQKLSGPAIELLLEKLPDIGECGFRHTSQFCHDRRVQGVLLELADAESGFGLRFFHFAHEVILEVGTDVTDLHLFAVLGEVVVDDELAGGRKVDDADLLKNRHQTKYFPEFLRSTCWIFASKIRQQSEAKLLKRSQGTSSAGSGLTLDSLALRLRFHRNPSLFSFSEQNLIPVLFDILAYYNILVKIDAKDVCYIL